MRKLITLGGIVFMLSGTPVFGGDDFGYINPVPEDANPLKTFRENSPNFGPGAVQNSLDMNRNGKDAWSEPSDVPRGHDIRDYNPYYNRDGSLKKPE